MRWRDRFLHRQWRLERLSSDEVEKYERNLECENKKEYDKFKEWQREYLDWKQYWEIGEALFKLEDKAYSLYCENKLHESFNYYKEILNLKHHSTKRVWIKYFNWYDKVLEICFIKYEDNLEEFFKNLYRITPENYHLCFDKARKISSFSGHENAIELGYKLYEVHPNDLDLIIFIESELYASKRYKEALKFSEIGLKIDDDVKSTYSKLNCVNCKLNCLIELNRLDEAIEFYKSLPSNHRTIDLARLKGQLEKSGKFEELLDLYYFECNYNPTNLITINSIKRVIAKGNLNVEPIYPKELYMDWIYTITGKNNHEICPFCGESKLDLVESYDENLEKIKRNKAKLIDPHLYGRDTSLNDIYLKCSNCKKIIDLGCCGVKIASRDNILLKKYVEDKITDLVDVVYGDTSLKEIKPELYGLDDKEFNAFITHLKNINFICEPRKGFIRLVDEELFKKVFWYWYE